MGIIKKLFGKSTKKAPKATLTEQFIRCPQCSTLYALFSNIVLETIGDVRCGTCELTFSAPNNRSAPKNKISLPTEFEKYHARLLRIPVEIDSKKAIYDIIEEPVLAQASSVVETTLSVEEASQIPETTPQTDEYYSRGEDSLEKEQSYSEAEVTSQTEESNTFTETTSFETKESDSMATDPLQTEESYQAEDVTATALPIQIDPLTSMQILAIAPGDAIASAPIYTQKRKRKIPRSTNRYFSGSAAVLLFVALMSLVLWLNRETLAQYNVTRPWLENICQVFNCTLSTYRDPSQIVVEQHQITPDSTDPNRFELHALIENASPYEQHLANLELTIKDLQGNSVKTLIFTPKEYAPKAAKSLLEPRQTLYIRLEFIQPTGNLFSYEIKFI